MNTKLKSKKPIVIMDFVAIFICIADVTRICMAVMLFLYNLLLGFD